MKTLIQPELKLKIASFDDSNLQVKERSNNSKFERDCIRTSSLVISTLDSTARFTNTVHIKDGAKSISL